MQQPRCTVTSAALDGVAEGPWDSMVVGDALGRADNRCSTPTGDRRMNNKRINNSVRRD